MLIASCGLTDAAFGRFPCCRSNFFPAGVDALILLGILRDLIVDRRIHKVYLYAFPLFIVFQIFCMQHLSPRLALVAAHSHRPGALKVNHQQIRRQPTGAPGSHQRTWDENDGRSPTTALAACKPTYPPRHRPRRLEDSTINKSDGNRRVPRFAKAYLGRNDGRSPTTALLHANLPIRLALASPHSHRPRALGKSTINKSDGNRRVPQVRQSVPGTKTMGEAQRPLSLNDHKPMRP